MKYILYLCKLNGINITFARKICSQFGINVLNLNKKKIIYDFKTINVNTFYNDKLEFFKKQTVLLLNQNHYKAIRRRSKLPINGQRTHTNAKTSKKLLN